MCYNGHDCKIKEFFNEDKNFFGQNTVAEPCRDTDAFLGYWLRQKPDQMPTDPVPQSPTELAPQNPDNDAMGENGALLFSPADLSMLPKEAYEFPYAGMKLFLPADLLAKMEARDVILFPDEDYAADGSLRYAALTWYALTEEQKNEKVEALDPVAWRKGLAQIGTLGVYNQEAQAELDTLAGGTEHLLLGRSGDGKFAYYLTLAAGGEETLSRELEQIRLTISEMLPIDYQLGKTAFAEGRIAAANVGDFTTQDVNGQEITREVFSQNKLTLVNLFATWCSPCVEEMPELQKIQEELAAQGIGVAAVVLDTVTSAGVVDADVVGKAKLLQDKLGLTFPLLLPDETKMNGRLQGIDSVPESFFVDSEGNIVSEAYIGARNASEWKEIALAELAKLTGQAQ